MEKCLFLGKTLHGDGGITSHRKAMLYARKEIDLVSLAYFRKNPLRLVTLFDSEDVVILGCSNRQRPGNSGQLVSFDKGRVSDEATLNAMLVMTNDVLKMQLVLFNDMLT